MSIWKCCVCLGLATAIVAATSNAWGAEPTSLMTPADPAKGWGTSNGAEFKGAKVKLAPLVDADREGHVGWTLTGDFTGGGLYVSAGRKLDNLDVGELRFWVRNPGYEQFVLRINDSTKQAHQISLKTSPGPEWQQIVLPLDRFFARRGQSDGVTNVAKYDFFGGAKDGRWHGPATGLNFLVSKRGEGTVRTLDIADVVITPRVEAVIVQPPTYHEPFETPLSDKWQRTGDVSVAQAGAFRGDGALQLRRTLEDINRPSSAAGPSFAAAPGRWEIALGYSTDLHSPDSSYSGVVRVECLDASGKILEPLMIVDAYGKHDWQGVKQAVVFPKGTTAARFVVQLNKTYGTFGLDELSVSALAPAAPHDDRIERLLFATAALGNLLLPDDPRTVEVSVTTNKPLGDDQQVVTFVLRDYWGAEQTSEGTMKLGPAKKEKDRFVYAATLDLSDAPLKIGRYYELHASLPQPGEEPFRNYTSLAILPEAITKQYPMEEVPFVSRNWDNRIAAYIRLSDRLGLRLCGIWGRWPAEPPYTATAPSLDLCRELGMGWITSTPAAAVERGNDAYDEAALRGGVRSLLENFGKERPLVINLGNEPHGTGEQVLKNVAAYRVLYEEIKKIDPSIPVVATAVEPNEEYFKAGYGNYCDAYDFHVYESADKVRRAMGRYRDLMQKYDCVKPIWSTELGLNSQGQTRQVVARELYKKTASFFAEGGERMSWFGLLYPDPEGKSHGSSGDTHNVFDCRYNRYAPRLDAVAYYNAVNSVAIKKFAEEKTYDDGVQAFLFRDREGRCLQILWKDRGTVDATVPLAGVREVQVVRIDGRRQTFDAAEHGITLSLGEDPQLLLYEQAEGALATALGPPVAEFTATPTTVSRNGRTTLTVEYDPAVLRGVDIELPLRWKIESDPAPTSAGRTGVRCVVTPPAGSAVREVDLIVTLHDVEGRACGALSRRPTVEP